MADTDTQPEDLDKQQAESLESSLDSITSTSPDKADVSLEAQSEETSDSSSESPSPDSHKKSGRLKTFRQSLNIYVILFAGVLIIALSIIVIAYTQSRHSDTTGTGSVQTQNLSQATLNQLADSDSTVGSSQYILNVESSAIFAGQVVMKQNLEVAGNLQVGGTSAFNNISVAGLGQFSQATVNNNLTVGGNSAVQGSQTIAKTLQVSNGGTFGGTVSAPQITTSNLQLNGDLVLQHHIDVSGPIPTRSSGPALGGGGSVSISGSDDAGSLSINTGSSPAAGCFVTVNFSTAYSTTPYVLVTPVGSAAGGLSYYVNRSTSGFSLCDASIPPSASSFGFDYFVVD